MLTTFINLLSGAAEYSLFNYVQAVFVAFVLYYIYAKTRTLAFIVALLPNIKVGNKYFWSILRFSGIRSSGSNQRWLLRATSKLELKRYNSFSHGIGTQNMLEITPHANWKPYDVFDWGLFLPHVAQAVRSKKFDYTQVSSYVQNDPVLQQAIKQATDQIYREQQQQKKQLTLTNGYQRAHHLSNGYLSNGQTMKEEEYAKIMKTENMEENDGITSKNSINSNNLENDSSYRIYQKTLNQQESRSRTILRDMRSTLNNYLLAFTSWLLYKLLPCFLTGVVTHTQQIEMLKMASEKSPGTPLIFLPLHRSHLDYILVTFILTNNDIRSPLVAAGNNLQIPIFGELLRGLGAFFIKRKIDPVVGKKDILYRAILQLYLQHALKMGHNVEFFIEGGRTRTGKPCMPKGGILSVIVNAFMDRSIPDALIVPVSVNYERLVDGNFVHEQKGEKKSPETFTKAISAIWKTLNSNYGLMRIDFNEPYSIKELVQSYNKLGKEDGVIDCNNGNGNVNVYKPSSRILKHNQSTSSLYGTDVICEEHRNLIESISRQVVYDCAAATSVMSTNALAFLLLTRHRQGTSARELAKDLDELRRKLKGQKDLGFSGKAMHIINYATDLLGESLVKRTKNLPPKLENNVNKCNNQNYNDSNEENYIADTTKENKSCQNNKDNEENDDVDDDEMESCYIYVPDKIESWIEMAYYAHTLTPHFALQSIIMTTFCNLLSKQLRRCSSTPSEIDRNVFKMKNNQSNKPYRYVLRNKLLECALENCEMYRYEYILHKPTQTLQYTLENTLEEMIKCGLISKQKTYDKYCISNGTRQNSTNGFHSDEENSSEFESDDLVDVANNEHERLYHVVDHQNHQRAMCEVLAPCAYTYHCVAQSLYILYRNSMLEAEFIRYVIKDIKQRVEIGECPYAESISTDSVRNCLKVLEKWSVIEITNRSGLRLLALGTLYETSRESIKNIIKKISNVVPNYVTDSLTRNNIY